MRELCPVISSLLVSITSGVHAQETITSRQQGLGHNFGDDSSWPITSRSPPTGESSTASPTARSSKEIGKTAEERPHYMPIVTSPENYRQLERYPADLTPASRWPRESTTRRRALAREGKAAVWIDGGLHRDARRPAARREVSRMVSRTDDETMWENDARMVMVLRASTG